MKKRIRVKPRDPLPATLGGERWTIVFRELDKERVWGQCIWKGNLIEIDPRLFSRKYMKWHFENYSDEVVTPREIVIHESLHAQMPWLSEPVVDRMARELDALLDEMGL